MLLPFPPPAQGFVTGVIMWVVARNVTMFEINFPGKTLIAGAVIGIGLLIELAAIGAFVQARTTVNPIQPGQASKLVTGGLYRISRNPMYLGLAILLSGWCLYLGELANLLVLVAFVMVITVLQIKPEESVLEEKFGDEYKAYLKSVRRWI